MLALTAALLGRRGLQVGYRTGINLGGRRADVDIYTYTCSAAGDDRQPDDGREPPRRRLLDPPSAHLSSDCPTTGDHVARRGEVDFVEVYP